jgi:hypothetical protein
LNPEHSLNTELAQPGGTRQEQGQASTLGVSSKTSVI